jgi:alkylglycerol monooxygenase
MWDLARRARRPLDGLRVLWMRPGWRPRDLGGPVGPTEVDRASYVKFDVPLARAVKLYVLGHFALVLVATTLYLRQSEALSAEARVAGAALVVWSLASFGALLDRRPWALPLEAARLAILAVSAALVSAAPVAVAGTATLAAASGFWLARALRQGLPLPAEVR